MRIILASKSPRRKELLKKLGLKFSVVVSKTPEVINSKLTPQDNSLAIALQKASNVKEQTKGERIIISADTIVLKDKTIFGKPQNRDDAYLMLKNLSGTCHEVLTSLVVLYLHNGVEEKYTEISKSLVYVDTLSEEEIKMYVDTYEWVDKAGGYAIQGEFFKHIKKIEGDYYGIMGLSVNQLYNILKKIM